MPCSYKMSEPLCRVFVPLHFLFDIITPSSHPIKYCVEGTYLLSQTWVCIFYRKKKLLEESESTQEYIILQNAILLFCYIPDHGGWLR